MLPDRSTKSPQDAPGSLQDLSKLIKNKVVSNTSLKIPLYLKMQTRYFLNSRHTHSIHKCFKLHGLLALPVLMSKQVCSFWPLL